MLTWTGERYLPELEGQIALEHLHRYAMARELAKDKHVLDIACGEGYGSAVLAEVANRVVGVDISEEVVEHARRKYKRKNLEFKVGSCSKIPVRNASVDLVVSFETIEHHDQHEAMMSEIKRVLGRNGVLIISSPEKHEYSVIPAYNNPFHVKELYRHEFEKLMASHFKHVAMYGQRVIYGSGILQEKKISDLASLSQENGSIKVTRGVARPIYLIAVASDGTVPKAASGVFEQPVNESEIVRSREWIVRERDGQIASLNQVVAKRETQIGDLKQTVTERDRQIASLKQSVFDLTEEAVRRSDWALRLDSELKESQSKLTAIVSSNSWRITLPLREARRWVDAPKAQSKRYVKEALRRLRRTYQALPLSAQTKALHRNWIARHAPRLLLASGAHPVSIPAVSISAPIRSRLLPVGDGASTSAELVRNIVLPASDSPIVSVIVPVFGMTDYTLRCLKSIETNPPRVPFEVIVVNDCSPDNSAGLFSKVSGIRLISNTENPGFIRSCNAGAKAACGEYLVFFNDDTEVTPDWMDRLLRIFDEFPGKERLKIAAVTMVYNEALVLPYFLRHYRYLDEIHVLYETDSTDESLEILMQAPNVVIERGHIEGGLDDIEKINLINKAVQRTKADWVYVVDPDEFIFPPNNESPHDFLKRQSCDVVRSGMFQVYRHRNDRDLDPSLTPVPQRAHGDPDLFSTDKLEIRAANNVYIKPNIVRPSKSIRFLPGHHQIEGDPQTSPELYVGTHWQMADPSIAIARRMERKARISERNRAHQMGWQHFDVTVDKIKDECERHLDDPVIDALHSFSETAVQNSPSGTRSDSLEQEISASVITGRAFRTRGNMYNFDPLQHPICLSSPRRTVPIMSWRQHVPFAMLLVDLLKPRTLVEIGVHFGDSYCAFCQAVAELRLGTSCYGVDTWKGDPHASFYGPEVLAGLTAHHDPLYGRFSHLIQSTFDEAVQHFVDGTIDILHIDGYHTYKAVKHDFETWLPKVSPRGVILFHDINEKQRDFGVWKMWDEVKVKYPHFEFLHCHGLGLIAPGERPPEELTWLFKADDEKAVAIRNFFFCLGDRLTDKVALSSKQESAAA